MRRERGDKNARNGFLPYVRAVWWRTFALRLIDLDRASAFLDGFVFASSAISLAPAFFFFNFFFVFLRRRCFSLLSSHALVLLRSFVVIKAAQRWKKENKKLPQGRFCGCSFPF